MGAIGLQHILSFRRKISVSLIITYVIAALLMWFLSDQIINILKAILPSILQGTDTAGVRYKLWNAAWRMWLDHRLQGVGIGMYTTYLPRYAVSLPPHYWSEPPHNTYLTALSETGMIGFLLFFVMLIVSLRNFLQSRKTEDAKLAPLRTVWLIVYLVVLAGGVTANGLYDKLLWFLFGISAYFRGQLSERSEENAARVRTRGGPIPAPERR
jgi:O-antigen ligase